MPRSNNLEIYYKLFRLVLEDPWIMPKKISEYFGKTGRGRAPSTWLRHLSNMYRKGISRNPWIGIKPHSDYLIRIFFCRKEDDSNTYNTFLDLHKEKKITYVMFLSGRDFLVASPSSDIDLRRFGLTVEFKSYLYTPIYTEPKGWNKSFDECLANLVNSNFEKGTLERFAEKKLDWNSKDWEIYRFMQSNIRKKWLHLARHVGLSLSTARNHFFSHILPECYQAHYFFPKGYDYYSKMVLRVRTKCEIALVKNLELLPCTSYVFPLQNEITVTLFHEDENGVLGSLEKMKEIGALRDYLLYTPIAYGY